MLIPFIGGAYTDRSTNLNAQTCINFFPVVDQQDAKSVLALYGTPGLTFRVAPLGTGVTYVVRALYSLGDYLYAVVNNTVYKIDENWLATSLGTISTSSGYVGMADNGVHIIIVDSTTSGYLINISAGTMAVIADADFPDASTVTFQDGYLIVTAEGTERIYISSYYDATAWNPLEYGTAFGRSDNVISVVSNTHDLWIFGVKSVEIFYNSGNTDFPFERIPGALLDTGCGAAASPVKINGLLYWLTEKGRVCRNQGYAPTFISTPSIDFLISSFSSYGDAIGFSYAVESHDFYVLQFPAANRTLVYDVSTNFWHEWQSYFSLTEPWGRHRSNCAALFNEKWVVGDYNNGRIYTLGMNVYSDNLNAIRRQRTGQWISKDRFNVLHHKLELEFEAGIGTSGASDVSASARARVSGGAVAVVTVVSGGSGYIGTPTITFSGGGGSGAAAVAIVADGVVTGITVTSGGSGYTTTVAISAADTTADTVTIPSGHGLVNGNCVTLTVTTGLAGLTTATSYFVIGAATTSCQLSAVLNGAAVNITSSGTGTLTLTPVVGILDTGWDPQAIIDWSDDGGHIWGNQHWTSMGRIGEYNCRAIWRRLGRSRNRIYRLTVTDPVKCVVLSADAELEVLKA